MYTMYMSMLIQQKNSKCGYAFTHLHTKNGELVHTIIYKVLKVVYYIQLYKYFL